MNIRVSQCEVGKFNLCGSELSLSFYMSIYDGNTIVVRDGVKAQLHYSGEPDDIQYFEDAVENICDVFERCAKYAGRVWSSTDYFAQCMTFASVYQENFDQITAEYVANRNKDIERKIERLQRELANDSPLDSNLYEISNDLIRAEIKKYTKWMDGCKIELDQVKEGTEKYANLTKKIEGYQKNIADFTSKIIPQPVENEGN